MITKIDLELEVLDFEPKIEIRFNSETLFKGVAQTFFSFSKQSKIGLLKSSNCIEIIRYGKNYKLDQSDTEDQAVVIKNIKLNNMTFPHIAMHGNFITDKNETIKTNYLGHNGVYKFSFGCPVETWIVNSKLRESVNFYIA